MAERPTAQYFCSAKSIFHRNTSSIPMENDVTQGINSRRLGVLTVFGQALVQFIKQTAVAAVPPVPLLCLNQPRFPQVPNGSAGGGFRELQIFGNSWNRRPANAVFIGAVGEVDVHRNRSVRQIHTVQLREIMHIVSSCTGGAEMPHLFFVMF